MVSPLFTRYAIIDSSLRDLKVSGIAAWNTQRRKVQGFVSQQVQPLDVLGGKIYGNR
jgi:hypothetical protein